MSIKEESSSNGDAGGREGGGRPSSGDDLEKLVVSVATRGMQQALHYGLRNTFFMLLRKKVRISETQPFVLSPQGYILFTRVSVLLASGRCAPMGVERGWCYDIMRDKMAD